MMLCLLCGRPAAGAAGGWLTHSAKVVLSDDNTVATAAGSGMDGWTSACGAALEGGGRHYVEVEWLAGDKLMVGVAGPSFDPTDTTQHGTRSSTDGWAYSAWSDGRLYHGGNVPGPRTTPRFSIENRHNPWNPPPPSPPLPDFLDFSVQKPGNCGKSGVRLGGRGNWRERRRPVSFYVKKKTLQQKMKTLQQKMQILQQNMKILQQKMKTLQQKMQILQQKMQILQQKLKTLQQKMQILQ